MPVVVEVVVVCLIFYWEWVGWGSYVDDDDGA